MSYERVNGLLLNVRPYLAESVKKGADGVSGAVVRFFRVPETLPEEVLQKMGPLDSQKAQANVPVCLLNFLIIEYKFDCLKR